MINLVQVMALAAVLCLTGGPAYAQGAGIEWETLIEEVRTLYRAGRYDRAATVAKKALEVAEKRVGLNHPDVATSLSNLAKAQGPRAVRPVRATLQARAGHCGENLRP
jgi:hypothetical protein